jgi:hypothetical protein
MRCTRRTENIIRGSFFWLIGLAIVALLGFMFYADPIQMLQALLGIALVVFILCFISWLFGDFNFCDKE